MNPTNLQNILIVGGALVLLSALAYDVCRARSVPGHSERGWASWYGYEHLGRPMANGQPFDPLAMTCAHRTYPFGTVLRVTTLDGRRVVLVSVTDRGPSNRHPERIIDLSRAAYSELADPRTGLIEVTVVPVSP